MRILTKLDIRNHKVVKGLQYEGVESKGYFEDIYNKVNNYIYNNINTHFEIILNDVTASLYDIYSGRSDIKCILEKTSLSLPHIVSGGIKKNNFKEILKIGVDRIMINTSLVEDISIIDEIIKEYGAQILIPTIETKFVNGNYYIYTNYGREETNIKMTDWIIKLCSLGIIEIFIISIDNDGLLKGYDKNLLNFLKKFIDENNIKISFLYGGGINNINETIKDFKKYNFITGICISSYFYEKIKKEEKINLKIKNENNINDKKKNMYFLNYLLGNKISVMRHFSRKYNCININSVKEIPNNEILCIPGHYNSYKILLELNKNNDFNILKDKLKNEKIKYIGICAGYQILFDYIYDEFDKNKKLEGLNIINSNTYEYINEDKPHIGFFEVNNNLVFFCHSYFIKNNNDNKYLLYYSKNNIIGLQFHPENSLNFKLNSININF